MVERGGAWIHTEVAVLLQLVVPLTQHFSVPSSATRKVRQAPAASSSKGQCLLAGVHREVRLTACLSQHLLCATSGPKPCYDTREAQTVPRHWCPGREGSCLPATVPWNGRMVHLRGERRHPGRGRASFTKDVELR